MSALTDLMTSWGSIYSNHAALRTLVAFAHVGALIAGGGMAVATDRALLRPPDDEAGRHRLLAIVRDTHRLVIVALTLVMISGVLLFASDFETFLYSRFFWAKMGLVVLLGLNGTLLWRAERQAFFGDEAAWRMLRFTAIASMTLWFLTTLGGVALPNIG